MKVFFAFAAEAELVKLSYPLTPESHCGSTRICKDVLDQWNVFSWADLVDEDFNTGGLALAAVRWYDREFPCTGFLCNDQLQSGNGSCPVLNAANHQFCGVTDELGNVLLSHAMGSNQARYEKLHNFTELLRHPAANYLQCWKFYINGSKVYSDYSHACVTSDSASDASIRILGAYAIACAKQRSGRWTIGSVDYCADYEEQGAAIWGFNTPSHGEIKLLGNGQYYLANGYQNQTGAPTGYQSFRPDYYELQFLMDFAEYSGNAAMVQGVLDMLEDYRISMGTNHIHRGKTGHFDATTATYTCDDLCSPPYMDSNDTWRAVPALSGLTNIHPEAVMGAPETDIFDYWWSNYSGGHPTLYGPSAAKPIEIYSNAMDGGIFGNPEGGYKTLGMWIPLGAAYSAPYTQAAILRLVDHEFDFTNGNFYGAAYYGGYYSQFAQRAIGAATGMIDPAKWERPFGGKDFFTVTPCRIYDSRNTAPLDSGVPRVINVGGICGIPPTARAISANLTTTGGTGQGHIVAYAGDGALAPLTTALSFSASQTRANNAMIELSPDGFGSVRVQSDVAGGGQVDVILDVNGFFQ